MLTPFRAQPVPILMLKPTRNLDPLGMLKLRLNVKLRGITELAMAPPPNRPPAAENEALDTAENFALMSAVAA